MFNRRKMLAALGSGGLAAAVPAGGQKRQDPPDRRPSPDLLAPAPNPPSATPQRAPNPVGPRLDLRTPLEALDSRFEQARSVLSQGVATLRIDHGLKTVVAESNHFRYQQVEQLLSQVAALLERGIASRTEWESLGEKSFATWLDLTEFADLDAIHADETQAGYYAISAEMSQAAATSEGQTGQALGNAGGVLDQELGQFGELSDLGQRIRDLAVRASPPHTNEWTADVNNDRANAIGAIARHSYIVSKATFQAQANNYKGQKTASDTRLSAANDKSQYDSADSGFRRRRTEAARRINALKAVQFTASNGAYNYEERRRIIQARFQEDFTLASERLASLATGLKLIYGFDLGLKDTDAPFDEAILAVRRAADWLSRFSSLEQNYIFPLSLRSLPDFQWEAGLSKNHRSGSWEFTLSKELFPHQAHVRLRGISAEVDCDGNRSLFQCAIRVPTSALIRFVDGSEHTVAQANIPVIPIGRVFRIDAMRPPDTVGTLALHNVSPIGTWKLAITSSQYPARNFSEPQDKTFDVFPGTGRLKNVFLNLHLAIRESAS
jgi:hypothetical protein